MFKYEVGKVKYRLIEALTEGKERRIRSKAGTVKGELQNKEGMVWRVYHLDSLDGRGIVQIKKNWDNEIVLRESVQTFRRQNRYSRGSQKK